jgi:signal peptidase I
VLVAVALVVTLVFRAWLAQAFYIPSASMEPQLRQDDRVLVSRTAYRLHEPRRGDIVVFPSPAAPADDEGLVEGIVDDVLDTLAIGERSDEDLIKRVVGLPGEIVEGRGGRVLVDGRALVEPYLPEGTRTSDFGPVAVPGDEVFVLGDNRGNSHDSRFSDIGTIEIDSLVGRAIARIWPPSRAAFL